MNKKIISLIIALMLPLTFLVGCNNSSNEDFVMTEDTTALDGSVEYNAKTYKDAFYSTTNYSDEYLQNEFETIVNEITSKEDKEELLKLLKSYSNTQDGDFDFVKSCFEKYNNENSQSFTLDSNGLHEISSRLYKATLNATKKYYDINDFYIYYKNQLLTSSTSDNDEDFENEVKITAIKEYTLANIYKNAYNDSFISKVVTSIENSSDTDLSVDNAVEDNIIENVTTEDNTTENNTVEDNKVEDNTVSDNYEDDTHPEYLELTEALKSQIYEAGVNAAIDYIGENMSVSSQQYCKEIYDALENDNPLGENKDEGYNYFLEGFKTTLENNNIVFQ